MNTRILAIAFLSACSTCAFAQEATVDLAPVIAPAVTYPNVTVKQLADETGLSPRHVRMLVGARSGYPEYRSVFSRKQAQFRSALGEQRYSDLMAGRPIELRNQGTRAIARIDSGNADPTTARP